LKKEGCIKAKIAVQNEFQPIIDKITTQIKKTSPQCKHPWDYFAKNQQGGINKKEFLNKIETIVENIDQNNLVALFENIDCNENGYASWNEFSYNFGGNRNEDATFNADAEQELRKLFDEIDEDGSASIDFQEFMKSFSKIGVNIT